MIAPGVDQSKIVELVVRDWRRMVDERRAKEEIWRECWLAYNSKFGKSWAEVAQYRSRRYLPVSFQAVENVASHLVQGIIPHDDWMTVEGRTPDDDMNARVMAPLLKWQHYKTHFEVSVSEIMRQAGIFGNAPWAMVWTEDMKHVPDIAQYADQLGAARGAAAIDGSTPQIGAMPQTVVREYDGPILVSGNIFDYVEDRYTSGSRYAKRIIRSFKDKAHLKDWAKPNEMGISIYENVENIQDSNREQEASDSLKRQVDVAMGFTDNVPEGVELLEFWGDFVIIGDDGNQQLIKNHVAVVANRTTLIRFEPNPFSHGMPPWNLFVLQPEPNETYGKGVLEPALGIQDAINVRFNQVIEANALVVNPMWKIKNDGTIDIDNFISAPGALHLVSDTSNIEPMSMPSNAALAFQEIGFLLAQFNEATNAMKAFTTADYQKSATEVAAVQGMVNSRFAQMVKHIERTFVIPALRMQIQLNQQFMDEAVWIRVVNPTNVQPALDQFGQPKPVPDYELLDSRGRMRVTPDDIQGEFDIFPVGAQWISNNQAAVGQLIQGLQVLGSIPQAAESVKWDNVAQFFFQMSRIPQSWKLIKSPMEVYFDRQQQLAQQAQQAAVEGGQGGAGSPKVQQGGGGPQSMAGVPGGPSAPSSPGGQATAGGPQTLG